jgi:hypothetical protein
MNRTAPARYMTVAALAQPNICSCEAISASFCLAEGGSHGPDHSERVLHTVLAIGQQMKAVQAISLRRPCSMTSVARKKA